ncbi:phage holin family protein [Halpernia sp. GG3]
MRFIIRLLITAAVAFVLSKYFLSGIHIATFYTAIIFAIVLALLNIFIKPILSILGLPLTIITLGLFSFVINALIILLASHFVTGMKVDGFWWALIFSIFLSVVTSLLSSATKSKN